MRTHDLPDWWEELPDSVRHGLTRQDLECTVGGCREPWVEDHFCNGHLEEEE